MHGRTTLRTALAAALITLGLPTAAAHAIQAPFTPACAADTQYRCLVLGAGAMWDGAVTRWRIRTTTAQTGIRLQTVAVLSGGRERVLGTSAPVSLAAGETREIAGPLPIVLGAHLALVGATGPTPEVEADLEEDSDGDGVTDGADACPVDALRTVAPCSGVMTFGDPLQLAPDVTNFPAGASEAVLRFASAPADGVIVRWRVRAVTSAPLHLQVLRPTGTGETRTVTQASAPAAPAAGGAVTTFDARLPVAQGDQLGLRTADGSALTAVAEILGTGKLGVFDAPLDVGATSTPSAQPPHTLLVQADVEPDRDHDGYGDVTQDACPYDPERQAGCTADVYVNSHLTTATLDEDGSLAFVFFIDSHGPDVAMDTVAHITLPPGASGVTAWWGAPCDVAPDGTSADCRLGAFDGVPPQHVSFTLPAAFVHNGASSTLTLSSRTPDPDPSNNSVTLTRREGQPWPGLVTTVTGHVSTCGTLKSGTTKNDTLRGTTGDDRLVGRAGKDRLLGRGGDDCLEGGSGNDTLDGGAGDDTLSGGLGNDKLVGGSGKDTIKPGPGRDTVSAGAGNDTIDAYDHVAETIDCGPGKDTIKADKKDRLKHCEKITRKR